MKPNTIGTAAEAVEMMGYTLGHFRILCRNGRIKGAWKEGREWLVPLPPEYLPRPEKRPKGAG